MRTVKEIAKLTGVSVRTLQYYDEIGVFKPTRVTEAGYRLYDDEALNTLQQILFYKELDFPLKEIKSIMEDPDFSKVEAFKQQKILLTAKRDRLNRMLSLLSNLEKGELCISFQEFDLSEYIAALETFKNEHAEEVIKHWGSMEKFDALIEKVRADETDIAKTAIQYYGSVEKYTAAMKNNLSHFSENMEKMQKIKEDGYVEKSRNLMKILVEDISKDVSLQEVQGVVDEIIHLFDENHSPNMDMGDNYWDILIDGYLHNPSIIEVTDCQYGEGASKFIGEAIRYYFARSSLL